MAKRLWVVEWHSGDQDPVPAPRLYPDLDSFDVVVADQFCSLVYGDYKALQAALEGYPYWHIVGHPADGRWVSEGGDEVYVFDAQLLDSEIELWEARGLHPEQFDAETWADVDADVVRDCVPTF